MTKTTETSQTKAIKVNTEIESKDELESFITSTKMDDNDTGKKTQVLTENASMDCLTTIVVDNKSCDISEDRKNSIDTYKILMPIMMLINF